MKTQRLQSDQSRLRLLRRSLFVAVVTTAGAYPLDYLLGLEGTRVLLAFANLAVLCLGAALTGIALRVLTYHRRIVFLVDIAIGSGASVAVFVGYVTLYWCGLIRPSPALFQ